MTASKNMLNMQEDETSRISKERDYYRTELDTLKAWIITELEEAAKTTASTISELRQQLDTESACKRAARLEAAHLRITMEKRDNASAARPQEHANAQGSSATSDKSAMGVDHPTVGTTSTSPVSAQVASPISSAAGARHTTVGTILPPRTPAPAAISAVSRELAWSVLDPRVQETQVARDHPQGAELWHEKWPLDTILDAMKEVYDPQRFDMGHEMVQVDQRQQVQKRSSSAQARSRGGRLRPQPSIFEKRRGCRPRRKVIQIQHSQRGSTWSTQSTL